MEGNARSSDSRMMSPDGNVRQLETDTRAKNRIKTKSFLEGGSKVAIGCIKLVNQMFQYESLQDAAAGGKENKRKKERMKA